jgi:hypothetical protein
MLTPGSTCLVHSGRTTPLPSAHTLPERPPDCTLLQESPTNNTEMLTLTLMPDRLAVCRMAGDADLPAWAFGPGFFSVTRTADELSIVTREDAPPPGILHEPGWRCLKLEGQFDFALTGILSSLATPLADAGVGIFVMSTYNTDYILVKQADLTQAVAALQAAGHTVNA